MTTQIEESFSQLLAKLQTVDHICLTTHKSPDEDAISSLLSLYSGLISLYPEKHVRLLITGQPVPKYSSLRHFDIIEFVADVADFIDQFQAIVITDAGEYGRVSQKPDLIRSSALVSACIDHHRTPPDDFTVAIQDSGIPACAQMIYEFLAPKISVDQELGRTILVGILGDTGGLQFITSKQTRTLDIVKELLEKFQFDIQSISAPFDVYDLPTFAAVSELIKNTRFEKIPGFPDVHISHLSREYVGEHQLSANQVSEASHRYMDSFLRKIEGHPWGIVFIPKSADVWGISLRALPDSVNVRDLVEKLGIGGGHNLAAGGEFKIIDQNIKIETLSAARLFTDFNSCCSLV